MKNTVGSFHSKNAKMQKTCRLFQKWYRGFLQSDWSTRFAPYLEKQIFLEHAVFRKMIGNHIVHRLKVIPAKTNGSIFVKVSKTPFCPPFWPKTAKRKFLSKIGLCQCSSFTFKNHCAKNLNNPMVGSTKTFN